MKYWFKGHIAITINHIFQAFLVTYLGLLLVEQIWTGVVSNYLNLNYILIITLVLGVLDVFSDKPRQMNKPITKKDYVFIGLLAVLGFIIIKFKTAQLGWLSWAISIIAGVLIALLSILVLEDKDDEME